MQASRRSTGCKSPNRWPNASANHCTTFPQSSALFHALFCLTSRTFAGQDACKAAKAPAGKVCSFPTMICGKRGCKSWRSQTNAMCVKQHLRLAWGTFCTGSAGSAGSPSPRRLRLSTNTAPLPAPWNKQMDVSSKLILRTALPLGTSLSK